MTLQQQFERDVRRSLSDPILRQRWLTKGTTIVLPADMKVAERAMRAVALRTVL